jgi:hypothetical protein
LRPETPIPEGMNHKEDPMDAYEPPLAPVEPVKKPRGCFFYGCVTAICLSLVFLVVVGLLAYTGYRYYTRMIEQYTSTSPMELPKVDLPPEQVEALNARVDAFKKALDTGKDAEPLVLTADEINVLIAKNPAFKDRVHVEIPGDEIQGQISMPLGQIGLPGLAGRYLNGKASFHVLLTDGQLFVTLRSLEVNGKALPEDVLKSFRKQNLAADFANDPDNAKAIQKLESIEVKDGKLIIKPRARKDAAEENAKEPGASKEPSKPDEPQAAPKEEPKIEESAKPKDEKTP